MEVIVLLETKTKNNLRDIYLYYESPTTYGVFVIANIIFI